MHDHLDIRAEINERPLLHGPAVYEVEVVVEDSGETLYVSPVLYRTRADAEQVQKDLTGALFAARCGNCGVAADYIEVIEDPEDITAWCSEACRDESLREHDALERAGL